MATALIAACLPTLKPLMTKFFPSYFSDSYNLSSEQHQPSPCPPQQQLPRDRHPGYLSQEFNDLFSRVSHLAGVVDVESVGRPSTHGSEATGETHESEETLDSQASQRKYFDLKDGQIVPVQNRFSEFNICFWSMFRHYDGARESPHT